MHLLRRSTIARLVPCRTTTDRRPPAVVSLLLALVLATACDDATQSVEPVGPPAAATVPLQLTGARDSLLYGDTLRIAVASDTVAGDTTAMRAVVWTSSDTLTARVDSTGLITSVGHGPVTITATRGVRAGSATIAARFREFGRGRRYTAARSNFSSTCVLADDGAAYCMGYNSPGRLGTSVGLEPCAATSTTADCAFDLLPVDGGHRFQSLDLGYAHACALSTAGEVYCWGRDTKGELGRGSVSINWANAPVLAAGGTRFLSLAAAGHGQTCASRVADSVLMCWGHNDTYQLGRNVRASSDPRVLPIDNAPGPLLTVTTSDFGTCALTIAGQAYCWGQLNGSGTFQTSAIPTAVATDARFVGISQGFYLSCAITAAGETYCWGNSDALPGDGYSPMPIRIAQGLQMSQISATAGSGVCGITSEGKLYCSSTMTLASKGAPSSAMVAIAPTMRFKAVAGRDDGRGACAITDAGALFCWGRLLRRP